MTRKHLNTAADLAALRDARVGVRYNAHRTDLPDGSCYYIADDGRGRHIVTAFIGRSLRPAFIENYRTPAGAQQRAAAFAASRAAASEGNGE